MRNGVGTYTTASGKVIVGTWKDNRFSGDKTKLNLAMR